MSDGHSHFGTGPQHSSASPRIRRLIAAVLIPLILATLAGVALLWPSGQSPEMEAVNRVDGTILDIRPCVIEGDPSGEDSLSGQGTDECFEAEVSVDEGADAGTQVWVPLPFGAGAPDFAVDDEIVLGAVADAPIESRYEVLDFQRGPSLILLGALFALAVVALSRWKGVTALAGLGVSILILVYFVLPALVQGAPPLPIAIVGAALIMIVTLYLAHGFTAKTSIALIGTLISLALTGVLGYLFIAIGNFTGVADESIAYLGVAGSDVDARGLLLAGMVIGALGVLDDVTVTQASAVWEIGAADPSSSRGTLFAAGLRIGRDHVAATVNTLVLAYVGAALPLLLLFTVTNQSFADTLTTELVAQEVVRALVGGLGIVAAVPVTTWLAAVAVRPRISRGGVRRANADRLNGS